MAQITAPYYDSQLLDANTTPINNGGYKFIRGDACPSTDQLAKYWSIRNPRKIDQRRSWIQMKTTTAQGVSSVYLNQSTTWDFTAQIDDSEHPAYFQCHTDERIKDVKTGKAWELDNSRLEGTTEIKRSSDGHAFFYAHLEGNGGYDRAALLLVDIDPDKGVVNTYADRPLGLDVRDLTSYVEGKTMYITAATNNNKDVAIIKLNSDWSAPESLVATVLKGKRREAPRIYKIGDYYYLYSSATMGAYPSQTKYMFSKNLSSGWSDLINLGNATASDGQFRWLRTDSGTKRTTYTEVVSHWGANRIAKTYLGNVVRLNPIAINGTYQAASWYPEVDIDDVYGAVPVQNGKNISYGLTVADSENGNTKLLTDGSDSEDAPAVNHSKKPYTVTIDLGTVGKVKEVDFSSRVIQDPITYNKYRISVSTDGKTYTDVANGSSSHFSGFIPNRIDDSQSARYVRLTMLDWPIVQGSGSIYNPAKEGLFEISVYGSIPQDTTKPVFSGVGNASITSGTKFDPRAGVTARDDRDGDLTSSIKVSGSVNTAKAGTYTLTYTVSDRAGNTATVTRKITVTSAPAPQTKYAVKFDSNGGSSVASQSVTKGAKATQPKAPTRSGYTFNGWYTAKTGGSKYDFNKAVNANLTLYAQWSKNQQPSAKITFKDVNTKTPHADDINWLASTGISTGWKESDGSYTFRGMNSVKRQDMAAFLYRLAGSPAFDETKAKNPFKDVNAKTPHYKEILWLSSTGISTGWKESDGSYTFRGMNSVKRQDMAAFLHRFATHMNAKPTLGKVVSFRDVNAKTPHADDINWLARTGVTAGWTEKDGSKTFRGMNDVVRQDMAAFLHRMKTNVTK
ncbi:InlB B-repeat-containing protein [Bifidobacterium ramosum]|nr:InlB B-repeat-containing protein [Bifidobacterium ramosum]